ncbi:MAG: biopolymer transporter ExbD [Gammaproteobacteria bacterium]|nr:biopolymer transporter ExbD [Gammaproteobacteria bacterium]MDH5651568.1 biopolymer transporter ExbD [Gammaproteobacteria bacterium]
MKESRRAKRMKRHHARRGDKAATLNMVSLMDIFTILVFFLLVSAADSDVLPTPKAIKLPQSTSDKLAKKNIVIVINDKNIVVQNKPLVDTRSVANSKSPIITDLVTMLRNIEEESIKNKDDKPASKRGVTIMGDQNTHYKIIKKIMLSCATAQFANISFAVVQKAPGAN